MKMTVNDLTLNYKIQDNGRILPNSPEILEQVGLSAVSDKIGKFYDLLESADPNDIFKWVAYKSNVNLYQAKLMITKYLLLDCGCRMCGGTTKQVRVEEFNWLRNYLSGLEVQRIYSFDEVATMLNDIGFEISIHKEDAEEFIKPSQLYEFTINNLQNFSLEEQGYLLMNLNSVKWIPKFIEELSPEQKEIFKLTELTSINNEKMPFCLMSLSCMIYNLKKHGIDVTELEDTLNNSKRTVQYIEELKMNFLS